MVKQATSTGGKGLQLAPIRFTVVNRSGGDLDRGAVAKLDLTASATEATVDFPAQISTDLEQIAGVGTIIAADDGGLDFFPTVLLLEDIADDAEGEVLLRGCADYILTDGTATAGGALTNASGVMALTVTAGDRVIAISTAADDANNIGRGLFDGWSSFGTI